MSEKMSGQVRDRHVFDLGKRERVGSTAGIPDTHKTSLRGNKKRSEGQNQILKVESKWEVAATAREHRECSIEVAAR